MKKQKLELTWIGKEKRPKLEPRILLEDAEKSYHAKRRVSEGDIFDNRLIFGDNLLALKALEQEFSGKVKCVFIDPPTIPAALLAIMMTDWSIPFGWDSCATAWKLFGNCWRRMVRCGLPLTTMKRII